MNLSTYAKNTWCPGCGNFGILAALKKAISSLVAGGLAKENLVAVSGIGCASKIIDYLDINSFSSLHGRPVISAEGIKLGNPDLKVIVSVGDGGTYNEGISHLIYAAKRNSDITVLVHDNRNFALTAGQFTATSPRGFKGKSSPQGSIETPFNPLKLMLASGATFIARGYSAETEHLKDLIIKGVQHRGFSFIEILQPCVSFFNTFQFYNAKVYKAKNSERETLKKIEEWDYDKNDNQIPIGIFYKIQKPVYEEELLKNLSRRAGSKIKNKVDFKKIEI